MKFLKSFCGFFGAPILSLLLFVILFQLWKVDLSQPIFSYDSDSLFSAFEAKIVIEEGWFFESNKVGLPHSSEKFFLHDFPLQADSFHFLIFKILSYFTNDHFLAVNCFFLLSFILISLASFVALRAFGITTFSAIIISVLYAFTPYHFYRNILHNFLSNYFIIPLIVMVALWITSGKIKLVALNDKAQLCLKPNCFFWYGLLIALFVAANGIYYALYSCLVFTFAWFLCGLKKGYFFDRDSFIILVFISLVLLALFVLYIPSFSYWLSNGLNSQVGNRNVEESQFFSLRIVNLFLPVANHYFEYFQNLRMSFNEAIYEKESAAESLGILASIGFTFLLLWLVAKTQASDNSIFNKTLRFFSFEKSKKSLISDLAGLNLLIVLFATAGGLIMFIAMPFPLIRSHARFSIFIAFISLFLIAIIFDKILLSSKKRGWVYAILSMVFILSLLDQVGMVSASYIQSEKIKKKFSFDQQFIGRIEQVLPSQSMIFQMPLVSFPEDLTYDLMIGYLHSKNLRWSYPAMCGRASYLWQGKVLKLSFEKFIDQLKQAGFSAIYIDRLQMAKRHSWKDLRDLESHLKSIAIEQPLVSKDLRLSLFKI